MCKHINHAQPDSLFLNPTWRVHDDSVCSSSLLYRTSLVIGILPILVVHWWHMYMGVFISHMTFCNTDLYIFRILVGNQIRICVIFLPRLLTIKVSFHSRNMAWCKLVLPWLHYMGRPYHVLYLTYDILQHWLIYILTTI